MWHLVWKGGLDLLTRPNTEEKENSEVDNWSDWPPGRITGWLEDTLIKTLALIQYFPQIITYFLSIFPYQMHCPFNFLFTIMLHFPFFLSSWKSTVALGAFLHACVCVCTVLILKRTEGKCTKKAHCPNCNLVCRVTYVLVKEINDAISSVYYLTIFGEVNYIWKCQVCLFPIKEWGVIKYTYSSRFIPQLTEFFCLSSNIRLWLFSSQSYVHVFLLVVQIKVRNTYPINVTINITQKSKSTTNKQKTFAHLIPSPQRFQLLYKYLKRQY